jgi:surface antigen
MLTKSALLLAAAAMAGLSASEAEALTPLAIDLAIDPAVLETPSQHATLAPRAFERPADDTYEPTAYVADPKARLQCVPFAREEAGVEIYGNANTWWRQARGRYETAQAPEEGGVLVLRGFNNANRGHVAVVREIVSPRLIIVDHANWLNAGEITRNVPIRDVSPNGDWSQVQVWHVPGRHWGARTYQVQGFILDLLDEAKAPQQASAAPAAPAVG